MNKNLKILILGVLVLTAFVSGVKADRAGFEGSVQTAWAYVTSPNTYNAKNHAIQLSGVDWQTSNKDSHKLWFRVVNSNGENRGSSLHNYLESKVFDSSAQMNYYYWLQAKRENFWDPATYVTGYWLP